MIIVSLVPLHVLSVPRTTRILVFLDMIDEHALVIGYFPVYMMDIVFHAAELHTRDLLYLKYLITTHFQPAYSQRIRRISQCTGLPFPPVRHTLHPIVSDEWGAEGIMNRILLSMMPMMFLQSA